jgi:hypothetical protein
MRLALSLALLPLLASAVPTSKPLSFQTGDNELLPNTGFSVDLNELRLVQFAEDEPAV